MSSDSLKSLLTRVGVAIVIGVSQLPILAGAAFALWNKNFAVAIVLGVLHLIYHKSVVSWLKSLRKESDVWIQSNK